MSKAFRDQRNFRLWLSGVAALAIVASTLASLSCMVLYKQEEIATLEMPNDRILTQLVTEVDKVCVRLGRAPMTETELVHELGNELPKIRSGKAHVGINYDCRQSDGYRLMYVSRDGMRQYLSNKPRMGWHKSSD